MHAPRRHRHVLQDGDLGLPLDAEIACCHPSPSCLVGLRLLLVASLQAASVTVDAAALSISPRGVHAIRTSYWPYAIFTGSTRSTSSASTSRQPSTSPLARWA